METRSKTRGGPVPSSEFGQVSQSLQSPPARSSSESSLNLTVIWDDWTPGIVGPSLPEVGAEPNPNIRPPVLTSGERVSAAAEVNADRKPMNDYHRDGGDAGSAAETVRRARNPTLVSCSGAGTSGHAGSFPTPGSSGLDASVATKPTFDLGRSVASVEPEDWSPRAQTFTNRISNDNDEYFYDEEYAVCGKMLAKRNVSVTQRDMPSYYASRAPVVSPEMHGIWEKSHGFQPVNPGHFGASQNSPRGQESPKPKSRASSRASSKVSGVNLNWLGDFMSKFVDDATNREKRDMDFMKNLLKEKDEAVRERERLSLQMAMQREKEIRDDIRQLAASEARVAALQLQLQGQTFQPPNSRSDMFGPSSRSYFADYPLRSKQDPWFSSPMMKDTFGTPVSDCTTGTSMFSAGYTPLSSFVGNISCSSANVVVCNAVSQDTTTVSVLGARPTPSTTGGSQPVPSGITQLHNHLL